MENRGYSIYEIGIIGGNDKGEIKFISYVLYKEIMFSTREEKCVKDLNIMLRSKVNTIKVK